MKSRPPESHWPLTILMGISSLFNLFLPIILVRTLNAEQVGLYKLFFLYSVTAPWVILSSGFGKGIYFWSGHWGANKESRFESFSASWSFQLCWSAGVLVVGALFFPLLKQIPSFLFSDSTYLALLILCVTTIIPVAFYEECRIARGENKKAGLYAAFWDLLRTVALLIGAFYFKSIFAVICAFVGVTTLKLAVSSYLVVAHGYAKFSLKNNPQTRAVWNYALPLSGAAALTVIFSYCDQFILGYYLSASEFALYSLGCLSIPPLYIFEQSINKVMVPQLTKAMSQNMSTAWKIVRFTIMDLGLWLIPATFGLFFFAGPITRMLFTTHYPETEYFLKVYCLFYLTFVIPYDAWERAQGRSTWVLKSTAVFAALSLISTWAGAKFYGAYAALTAYLACQFLYRFYSVYTMKKRLGWKVHHIIPTYFLTRTVFLSLIIGIATSWLLKKQTEYFGHEIIALFIWGTVFWILYVIICVPWAIRKERRERNAKKVLLLTQYLNIGGLERMIYNLAQEYRREGSWEPSVFVYDHIPGIATMDDAFGDIPVFRQNKKHGFSLRLPLQIAKLCRQEGIDHIHAHDLGALIYAVMAKWASFGRLRVVYTLHSFVHLERNKRHKHYEKFFTKFADVVTTVSEQLKNIFGEIGVNTNKILVIENGVPFPQPLANDDEKRKLKTKLLPGKENLFWILSLARLHPGKGQLEAIAIWNQLPEQVREKSLLVFVGGETQPGYAQIVEQKKEQAHTSGHIILAGSTLEPTPWLQASDLFISASLQEGLPLAPLEALALEIPVVLSDIAGHQIFDKSAHLFPVNNFDKGSEVLAKLINQPKKQIRPQNLLNRFSVERMAQSYIKAYTEK